jgi:hypothetical protein
VLRDPYVWPADPSSVSQSESHIIPRDTLTASLNAIIRPAATDKYAAISGKHGTGKTTAVQSAVREGGKGAVYFLVKDAAATETAFR